MELEQRVTRLEERTAAVERDTHEIKLQLNETAKKSDVERLERTLNERDANYTKELEADLILIVKSQPSPWRRGTEQWRTYPCLMYWGSLMHVWRIEA